MGIRVRENADGTRSYVVRERLGWTLDGHEDRPQATFPTMREAKVEQAKLVAMRDARRNRSGKMALEDYIERVWWPSLADLSPTTRDTYERELRLRILPALGRMDVRDIDRIAIQQMVDGCKTRKVAEKAVATLKTILNECRGDGLVASNPACATFRYPPVGRRRDSGVVVTRFEEMRPLVQAVREYGNQNLERLAVTGLYMGLRPEERYGLDDGDIDTEAWLVDVHRAYVPASRREGGVQPKGTKTELSTRLVPVPPAVREWVGSLLGAGGPFVKARGGGRLHPGTAQHQWAAFLEWCEREGRHVPRVTLENMRHSFATSYLHAGGNVEDLSRILGHSDINTTYRRYVRPAVDDLARGMESFVTL